MAGLLIGRADVLDIVTTPNCCAGVTSPDLVLTPTASPLAGGSSTVFIGGKGVHRQSDATMVHAGFPILCVPHVGLAVATTATVFVNGSPVMRMGDVYSNGEILTAPQVQAVAASPPGGVYAGV